MTVKIVVIVDVIVQPGLVPILFKPVIRAFPSATVELSLPHIFSRLFFSSEIVNCP